MKKVQWIAAATALCLVFSLAFAFPLQAAPIDDVRTLLEQGYVEDVPAEVLQAPSVDKMLELLGDPYTNYMTGESYQDFRDKLEDQSITGIGVQIEGCPQGVLVLKALPGSPAEAAGIKSGDIIVSADGTSLAGMASEQAVSLIRGPAGTTVELQVLRDSQTLKFSVQRSTIDLPTVTGELLDGHIGYLEISSFGSETSEKLAGVAEDLKKQGADSWIVSVRNNGGGYLSAAIGICGQFMGSLPAVKTTGRLDVTRVYRGQQDDPSIEGPVIVLVNEFSASASEVLAGALKANHRALVIGRPSFGKGTVQTVFYPLSEGGALKMTIARFYAPDGSTINHMGIEPDLVVDDNASLDVARLLLSSVSEPRDKTGYVSARIFGSTYYIDTRKEKVQATALAELLEALPPRNILLAGTSDGWAQTDAHLIASQIARFTVNWRMPSDVAKTWAEVPVGELASRLIVGDGMGSPFLPNRPITRAELAALVAKGLGLTVDTAAAPGFKDVDARSWYADEVAAVVSEGIMKGYGDGRFCPGSWVTRQECATVMFRALAAANQEVSSGIRAQDLNRFKDTASVSTWAKDELSRAVGSGIIGGRPDSRLAPREKTTRAEAAVMMERTLALAERI